MPPILLPNGLPITCSGCALSTNPKPGYFTKVSGSGRSGVLIVAEASGEHEAREGRPLIEWAPSGSILEKAIRTAGHSRDDFWITNIVRCRPPNNYLAGAPYERDAIDHCKREYLDRTIGELKPRAILALGAIPLRELTGRMGERESISYLRGYVLPGPDGIPVIPTFHPSYITRKHTALIGVLIRDINTARAAAAGRATYVVNPKEEIELREGIKAFEDFLREVEEDIEVCIAFDLETLRSQKGVEDELVESGSDRDGETGSGEDYGEMEHGGPESDSGDEGGIQSVDSLDSSHADILSIQFAISDAWGIYGDYRDPKIRELAQRVLATKNPKVGHNVYHFDIPVLERNGVIVNGEIYDTLSMIKALQPDLPAKLQSVAVNYGWKFPWKHQTGIDDIFYGICDVCSVVLIMSKLALEMEKLGMWDGYQRYIREQREKSEIPWERRGIPMNVRRINELRSWIEGEVNQKVDDIIKFIPEELHKMEPTDEGFSNLPDEIKSFVYQRHPEVLAPLPRYRKNGEPLLDEEGNQVYYAKPPFTVTEVYNKLLKGELNGTLNDVLSNFPDLRVTKDGTRLYRFVPFNPRSSKQMIEYIKYKGYEVPKTFREGKDTTGDKVMRRLQEKTKDPVIALAREIRALNKMMDSYTGKMGEDGVVKGGWIPDADGRLRTRAMTNSTWQYSARAPNVFTCFPPSVEILTKQGWKGVAHVVKDDLVGQFHIDDQSITWTHPVELIKQSFDGKLSHIQTEEQIDILATSDHQCLLQNRRTKKWSKFRADIYPEDMIQWSAGLWKGEGRSWPFWEVILSMALQADGHVENGGYGISFKFMKDRKVHRLRQALEDSLIPYTVYNHKNGATSLRLARDNVPAWLWERKLLGEWLLDSDEMSLKLLVEELFIWDGDSSKKKLYWSTIKSNVDWAQLILTLVGRRAKIFRMEGRIWGVTSPDRSYCMTTNRTIVKKRHKGNVFCVEVPSGNIIVRHNNRVAVIGNCPKRGVLAPKFRRCIAAEPGHEIVELDFKSFHDLTTAALATDEVKWRTSKIDSHSYVAAWLVRDPRAANALKMSDPDLKEYLKEIKERYQKVRDDQAKPLNHGFNFGESPNRLYYENEEFFESLEQAKQMHKMLGRIYPKTVKWQEELLKSLDLGGGRVPYLQSVWGARRWFWDVWTWRRTEDGHWYKCKGQDAEKALAFLPANNAHGMFRHKMLAMAEWGWLDRFELILFPHDAMIFHPPMGLVSECIEGVKKWLEEPVKELANPVLCPEGLSCAVDVKVGPDMKDMREVH